MTDPYPVVCRYGEVIKGLQAEFDKKVKKGKLPAQATARLMSWWDEHFAWPYPTDDDKQELADECGEPSLYPTAKSRRSGL